MAEVKLPEGVKVKALKWREGEYAWFVVTPFGHYEIFHRESYVPKNGMQLAFTAYVSDYAEIEMKSGVVLGYFAEMEAAKFAAQTHYEQRILSAMTILPTTLEVGEDEVEAERSLRDIAQWLMTMRLPGHELEAVMAAESIKRAVDAMRALASRHSKPQSGPAATMQAVHELAASARDRRATADHVPGDLQEIVELTRPAAPASVTDAEVEAAMRIMTAPAGRPFEEKLRIALAAAARVRAGGAK